MYEISVITGQNALVLGLAVLLMIWVGQRGNSGAGQVPRGPRGLPVFGKTPLPHKVDHLI
jgi:hypothetical protein